MATLLRYPKHKRAAARLEVVGLGRPGGRARAGRRGAGDAARAGRRAGAVAARRRAGATSSCPPAEPLPRGADRGGRRGRTSSARAEDRVRHATGCGYTDLARLRAGGSRRRPTRSCCPPTPTRCGGCSTVCAAEGVAVVPFGGGTSVVGGVEPLRGGHSRLVSLDLARLRERRGRPPLADRPARRRAARPGGRGGAERRGRHPRPLPAVVRVRDDRRLRRDPLRRPGLERLRALRRAGQRDAADRARRASCARWRRRTPPPGRRCASSSSARRGRSG